MNKRRFLKLGLFFLAIVLLPTNSYAQGILGDSNDPGEVIGGVDGGIVATATLTAAALETGGYVAQAQILSQMGDMLYSLGALVYVVILIGAVILVAGFGEFKWGMTLILAPPVFFFVTQSKVHASGAEWRMGGYRSAPGTVQQEIGAKVDAEVSWVFHRFNRLVSDIIQQTILVVTNGEIRSQMMFMARPQIMEELFNLNIVDQPDLMDLVEFSANECYDAWDSARAVALGKRDPMFTKTAEYLEKKAYYDKHFKSGFDERNVLPVYTKSYVRSLLEAYQKLRSESQADYEEHLKVTGQQCMQRLEEDLNRGIDETLEMPVTCEQLWCWMGSGIKAHVSAKMHDFATQYTQSDIPPEIYQEILYDIETKMTHDGRIKDSASLSGFAKRADEYEMVDGVKVYKDIRAEVMPDESLIPVIVMGHILRRVMASDPRSKALTSLSSHFNMTNQMLNFNLDEARDGQHKFTRIGMMNIEEERQKSELYTVSLLIPYVQGVLLYILAATFPFFALLILIPGFSRGFVQWMFLWLWVKSWDLGWAFVMVVDDLIWNIMPHSSEYNFLDDPSHGPVSVFEAAFHGDYSYSTAHYFALIGMLIVTIPVLTGQLVLGSKSALANRLFDGAKDWAEQLGGGMSDWAAVKQLQAVRFLSETNRAAYALGRVERGMDANEDVKAARKNAEEREKKGKSKRFWAAVGIAAIIVVAVVAGVATGGAALVAAGAIGAKLAVSGLLVARAVGNHGIDQIVNANFSKSEINKANADFFRSYAGQTNGAMMLDNMRAGLSGRNEFWVVPDAPVAAYAKLQQTIDQADRADSRSAWYHGGMAAAGVLGVFTLGRGGAMAKRGLGRMKGFFGK